MNTTFLTQIKTHLPEQAWSWVYAALSQDELVWETLLAHDATVQAPQLADRPDSWNPAWAAFMCLDWPVPEFNASLSLGLRQRAFQTYEVITQRRQSTNNNMQPIQQAVLLALALRERLRLTGKWENLIDELSLASSNIWRTPLACLYGLVEKPFDFLRALLIPGAPVDITKLAIHAILCNPISPESQYTQLKMLMENLPLSDQQNLLQQLSEMRPALTADLARSLEPSTQPETSGSPLGDLAGNSQRARIAIISGNHSAAMSVLRAAQDNARLVQASLAAQNAQISTTPLNSWREAFEFAPEQPIYRANLALALLDADDLAEAGAILDPSENPGHPDLLYASARLAHLSGDTDRARQLASQALSILEMQIDSCQNSFDAAPSLAFQLGKFLLAINLPSAAIRAARYAIRARTDDSDRLILMGQAQTAAGQPLQAAVAYHWAVLLVPQRVDIHRSLAESLEASGEWASALEERKFVASIPTSITDDQYALADCALHNRQSAYVIEICNAILLKDPADGMAHTLMGEALAAQGDLASAQEQFTQASELAPNLPRPWLALANAYDQINQPQKALETLRIASQAIPGCADVHLALGEQYLSINSPTQALSAFQRANEIEPRNIPVALRYSQTLYQLGHLPQAHQILKLAYQQDPTNIQVAHTYARILLGMDDPKTALPPLEYVIASNPIDSAPFVDYARAKLLTNGEATNATQALRHALELDPNHSEAKALLGEALASEKDYPGALQAYQTALENPQVYSVECRARLSYGLGNVALHLGKIEIAIAALLEAVQLDPQNYRPHCLLADAYQTVKLIPDAYQSSREALRLAGDDLTVMIWFAEKALVLAEYEQPSTNEAPQAKLYNEDMHQNALQILARAAEIASTQSPMLIRIATIEASAGDPTSAVLNLRQIARIDTSTLDDLQKAAQSLLGLHDPKGAVACFERALEIERESGMDEAVKISFLTQLTHAYQLVNNPQSALQTIEKAILLSPNDSELCHDKAYLLIELGQAQTALSFLEETIIRLPDPRLHHLAGYILREQGKPFEALAHAEAGSQSQPTENGSISGLGQQVSMILAVELYQALLQPDKALHALQNQASIIKEHNLPIIPEYNILWAEVTLGEGKENEAANWLEKAINDPGSRSPRLLALQARLAAHRGDFHTAIELIQTALQIIEECDPGNNGALKTNSDVYHLGGNQRPDPYSYQSILYPLTEAALDLNKWATALRLAQKAVQSASSEPLAYLNLARVLVQRAEFQNLCCDTDVVHQAPGPIALSEGTRHAFDQAIQDVSEICNGLGQQSQLPEVSNILLRWKTRGNAVFSPSEQTAQELEAWALQNPKNEDIAAALAVLRKVGKQNEQLLTTNNQHSGLILTQIALTTKVEHPEEAIKALQLAILNEPIQNTSYAIRQYMLARLTSTLNPALAIPAIQTAITILPDEPRWHALAAEMQFERDDKISAINHLEQAIQLEPRHIKHHLDLGNLYLHSAEGGNVPEALQAIKALERATRISPDHPDVWLILARAHRLAGNLEQAAAAAERTTTLAPDSTASYLIQAEIAHQSGKLQAAHAHAQKALDLQPDSQEAALLLSRVLQALEKPSEALDVIDKVIPAMQQSLPLKIERIQLLRKSKGTETALQAANDLFQLFPDEPTVLSILAETQTDAGQEEIAIRTAQKAILLGENLPIPQQANLRLLVGQLLRRAGQLDQAVHHLDEVIHLEPEKIDAYLELGRAHQDRRQQAQALLMYRRAAIIAPHDPRPYLQAGLALKEGKDYIESESMLRRAADLAPDDPSIRRQLAAVIAINLVHNPRRPLQTEPL
jgi:tetratricopeptide (TPR) repeat protein